MKATFRLSLPGSNTRLMDGYEPIDALSEARKLLRMVQRYPRPYIEGVTQDGHQHATLFIRLRCNLGARHDHAIVRFTRTFKGSWRMWVPGTKTPLTEDLFMRDVQLALNDAPNTHDGAIHPV